MTLRRASIVILVLAVLTACEKKRGDVLMVKLDSLVGMDERNAKLIEMRQFLWNHWTEREPATLLLTTVSKEGKTTHAEYRIVSLPGNTLVLKVSFVRDAIGYLGQVISKPDGGYEAYTVERVQSENPFGIGAEAKVTVLPSNVDPKLKYWLRFKGWQGAPVAYF